MNYTNHVQEPNDRVCVCIDDVTAQDRTTAVPAAYTEASSADYGSSLSPQTFAISKKSAQIQYSIQIVEDSNDCMSEYAARKRGVPMMFAESKTLLPTMRVLQKHELVRQISAPRLICIAGETAQMEIGSDISSKPGGLRLEVTSEQVENGLNVELCLHSTKDERTVEIRTAAIVEAGQSIVIDANPASIGNEKRRNEQTAVYVVVTPEIVE
jgi:hypothetical protein